MSIITHKKYITDFTYNPLYTRPTIKNIGLMNIIYFDNQTNNEYYYYKYRIKTLTPKECLEMCISDYIDKFKEIKIIDLKNKINGLKYSFLFYNKIKFIYLNYIAVDNIKNSYIYELYYLDDNKISYIQLESQKILSWLEYIYLKIKY